MRFTLALAFLLGSNSAVVADPAGDLLDQISKLHQTKFEALSGHLLLSWMQLDENEPRFVVYIGNRRYDANLDDGRIATETATKCAKDNPFSPNPNSGCSVAFDGQYLVKSDGGNVEVSTIIWNIKFKN